MSNLFEAIVSFIPALTASIAAVNCNGVYLGANFLLYDRTISCFKSYDSHVTWHEVKDQVATLGEVQYSTSELS